MENFGYLEMAIAQETNRQFHQPSPQPQQPSDETPQQQLSPHPTSPSAMPTSDELSTHQIVGWWGLF